MKSTGEQLMCEFLDVYLEGDEHIDNYRPAWLTNSATGQPLEIDRYYPKYKVGYEYQGEQHLRQVDGFGDVDYRRRLDRLKTRLAYAAGVEIVRVEPIDLQIHPMYHKAARAYRHLRKLEKSSGKEVRRAQKRHQKDLSSKIRKARCKELSKRAAEYRHWLDANYGEQVGVHQHHSGARAKVIAMYESNK